MKAAPRFGDSHLRAGKKKAPGAKGRLERRKPPSEGTVGGSQCVPTRSNDSVATCIEFRGCSLTNQAPYALHETKIIQDRFSGMRTRCQFLLPSLLLDRSPCASPRCQGMQLDLHDVIADDREAAGRSTWHVHAASVPRNPDRPAGRKRTKPPRLEHLAGCFIGNLTSCVRAVPPRHAE